MNRFLIVVGLIVVCVIGAGFYFGYLRIESDSVDGTSHMTLTAEQKNATMPKRRPWRKCEEKSSSIRI